jgi:hypothetical protein
VHGAADALKVLPSIFAQIKTRPQAVQTWTQLFQVGSFTPRLMKEFPKGLSPETLSAALQAARSLGRNGQALVKVIEPLAGAKANWAPILPTAKSTTAKRVARSVTPLAALAANSAPT